MRRTTALATALLVIATLGVGACSDEDEFTEDNLADQLVEQGLFEEEEADCIASTVFDELDDDELSEVEDAFDSNGELPPALQEALTTGVESCVQVGG
jgi:hypothetical protein